MYLIVSYVEGICRSSPNPHFNRLHSSWLTFPHNYAQIKCVLSFATLLYKGVQEEREIEIALS